MTNAENPAAAFGKVLELLETAQQLKHDAKEDLDSKEQRRVQGIVDALNSIIENMQPVLSVLPTTSDSDQHSLSTIAGEVDSIRTFGQDKDGHIIRGFSLLPIDGARGKSNPEVVITHDGMHLIHPDTKASHNGELPVVQLTPIISVSSEQVYDFTLKRILRPEDTQETVMASWRTLNSELSDAALRIIENLVNSSAVVKSKIAIPEELRPYVVGNTKTAAQPPEKR
jgi:hypothetical protein